MHLLKIPRTFLAAVILVMSSGSVALADPADQAATAVPTPTCVVPPSGVVLDVSNPNPGASLSPGSSVIITGTAFDQASTSGAGISSVTAYLGNRDTGGIFLGNAALDQASGGAGPAANAGFTLRSSTLPPGSGSRDLFVYAKSSVTGNTASVDVPVFLGPAPTAVKGVVPTAVLPPPPACTPTPTPAPTNTPTPVPAAPAAVTTPVAVPTAPPPPPTLAPTIALPTLAPLPTPAPAEAPAPAAATPVAAVAPATATTAPRGGGIPAELGLPLLAIGALIFGGGYALRRRKM